MWKKVVYFLCSDILSELFFWRGVKLVEWGNFPIHDCSLCRLYREVFPPDFCACMLRSMKSVYCAKRDNKMSVWKIDNFLLIVESFFGLFSPSPAAPDSFQHRRPECDQYSELWELVQSINKRVFRVCSTFYSCVWFFDDIYNCSGIYTLLITAKDTTRHKTQLRPWSLSDYGSHGWRLITAGTTTISAIHTNCLIQLDIKLRIGK